MFTWFSRAGISSLSLLSLEVAWHRETRALGIAFHRILGDTAKSGGWLGAVCLFPAPQARSPGLGCTLTGFCTARQGSGGAPLEDGGCYPPWRLQSRMGENSSRVGIEHCWGLHMGRRVGRKCLWELLAMSGTNYKMLVNSRKSLSWGPSVHQGLLYKPKALGWKSRNRGRIKRERETGLAGKMQWIILVSLILIKQALPRVTSSSEIIFPSLDVPGSMGS